MANNLGNLASTVSLNIDPFQQSARVLDRQMRTIDQTLKANEAAFKSNSKNILAQKSNYALTGKAIEVHNAKLAQQKEHYEKLKTSIGDVSSATADQKMDLLSAEGAIANTTAKLEGLNQSYANLGKQIAIQDSNWTKFGDAMDKGGQKLTKMGDGLDKFGNKMTLGVTVPLIAGVTAVTKAAIDWESSFAGVTKTSDEVVDANGKVIYSYKDLESGLRNLAKELPSTHTEIAQVAEAAGQLGIATQDVTSFTKTMIDLGESTNLSAEDAATAIAKIANITGMTSDEYERFGSSVVALGNNFATTEADIVALSNRLAAAGTLAGLSEAEILGLATAMSSVGIEAEAGGTAMTQTLTSMEKAITNGGEQLENFAKVSNMSTTEFAESWKNKPIEAIQAFITGLGELDGKGESATAVLDEMGLSGIRQSNMLKSLALASGTLTSAVETSGQAWSENTALSEEAGKRYATVESQLAMLKNEAVDIGIEFGGPFLNALRDIIQASKPLIENVANMATKFSEMDEGTQKSIIKFIGFAAAIGPVSKVLGGLFKVVGGGMSTVGKLSKNIGKLSGGATALSGATGLAQSSVFGFTGALGALTSPLGLTVAAIGAGVVVWKLWGEEAVASARRTREWGVSVSEEQGKVIETTQELELSALASMSEYAAGVAGSAEKVKEAYQGIADEAQKSAERQVKSNQKAIESLPKEMQADAKKEAEFNEKQNERIVKGIQSRVNRVNQITEEANANNRKLTVENNAEIMNLTEGMNKEQLKLLGLSAEEQEKIMLRMGTNLAEMTPNQLQKYSEKMSQSLDKQTADYKKNVENLEEVYKNNPTKLASELEKLQLKHSNTMDKLVADYARAKLEAGTSIEDMATYLGQWGYSVEEAQDLIAKFGDSALEMGSKLAQGTSEADTAWNSMIIDPKTGEVKDNLTEFLSNTAKSEKGWEQLKFITKEATLNSNAREEIATAVGQSGRWNELTFEEKLMLANGDQAMATFYETINANNQWNQAEVLIKELGVENHEAISSILASEETLTAWNKLPAELKDIIVNDKASEKIIPGTKLYENWMALPDSLKNITVKADTSGATIAQNAINNVRDKDVFINLYANDMASRTLTNKGVVGMRATGDPYFQGGPVILGDGGKQEPYVTPSGHFGISPATDTLFNLERGTKIWPSISKMMQTIPHYASGTEFDDTRLSRISNWVSSPTSDNAPSLSMSQKMDELIYYLKKQSDRPLVVNNTGKVILENQQAIGRWIAEPVEKYNSIKREREKLLGGGRN